MVGQQKHIAISLFMTIGVIGCLSLATGIRHQGFDLYLFNKVLAGSAGVLLGIVVVTGPFGRLYDFFDRMLIYRKWLGMAAFITGYAHGIVTLFFLPDKFPASRFHVGNIAFLFGLLSFVLLTVLFIYSFQTTIESLNRKVWWKLQNWGVRIAFVAGLLHAVIVKLPYWNMWFEGKETTLTGTLIPPLGLLITVFLLYIASVRVAETLGKDRAHKIITVTTFIMGFAWLALVLVGIKNTVTP